MKISRILLSVFIFVVSSSAWGRPVFLFLDMNNSPGEIEAAKVAARKSGKDFLVFPPKGQRYSAKDSPDQLARFLQQKGLRRNAVEQIFISGHHKTDSIYGTKASLSRRGLMRGLQMAGQSNGVKSLNLWGCYTGRPDIALEFQTGLPNLTMIAGTHNGGYGQRGPKRLRELEALQRQGLRWDQYPDSAKTANEKVLHKLITDQDMALRQYDADKSASGVKQLQHMVTMMGNGLMNFTFLERCKTQQKYFYEGKYYESAVDIYRNVCADLTNTLPKNIDGYFKWQQSLKGYLTLDNTKFPRGAHYQNPIRDFYAEMTRGYFCINFFKDQDRIAELFNSNEMIEFSVLFSMMDEYEEMMAAFRDLRPGLLDMIDQHKKSSKTANDNLEKHFQHQEKRREKAWEEWKAQNPNASHDSINKAIFLDDLRSKMSKQSYFADLDVLVERRSDLGLNPNELKYNFHNKSNRNIDSVIAVTKKWMSTLDRIPDSDPDKAYMKKAIDTIIYSQIHGISKKNRADFQRAVNFIDSRY